MKRYSFFILFGIILLSNPLRTQEPFRGPDGGTSSHVSGVELLAIRGKPFSATSNIEWTRTTQDGSTITVRLEAAIARDSEGRIYRERRSFVPVNSDQRARLNEVHLYDPITRTQTFCSPKVFRCVITDYSPKTTFVDTPPGSYDNGNRFLTRENLGRDVIDGLDVTGTRETWTINAGVIGNDKNLVSTREFWYSAELATNLLVVRNDPREGKQVVRLSNLSRSEPDPHTFDIPVGFSVQDARVPARHAR